MPYTVCTHKYMGLWNSHQSEKNAARRLVTRSASNLDPGTRRPCPPGKKISMAKVPGTHKPQCKENPKLRCCNEMPCPHKVTSSCKTASQCTLRGSRRDTSPWLSDLRSWKWCDCTLGDHETMTIHPTPCAYSRMPGGAGDCTHKSSTSEEKLYEERRTTPNNHWPGFPQPYNVSGTYCATQNIYYLRIVYLSITEVCERCWFCRFYM